MSKSASCTDTAKRTVVMPREIPFEVLLWLAGDPVILAASDEKHIRKKWAELRERIKAAERKRK